MALAKKLPSGSFRTQVTKYINGKRVVKSFTVSPQETRGDWRKAKQQSELLAREWQLAHDYDETFSKPVRDALEEYIEDRSQVLSPRTIYDYRKLIPFFGSVLDVPVDDMATPQVQALINEWSVSISEKTIRNRISFLLSALDYAGNDKRFKLRYPQKRVRKVLAPDVQDVQRLLDNAPADLLPILCLAAFGSLRRGEIAALKQMDISRDMNTVTVHADMVKTGDGYVYKDLPKTAGSIRTIELPKKIIGLLPVSDDPGAYVFGVNPNMISHKYDNLKRRCGISTTFHSLRHFAASFRSDLGVPRKYIEEVGGWREGSRVMVEVYDNTLTSTRKKYTQMTNKYIEDNFKIKRSV